MAVFNKGVYKIENNVNGKVYIGSSCNLHTRKNDHFNLLRKNKHCNIKLQRAYNKYGDKNLVFKTILLCEGEDLIMYEQLIMDWFEPTVNGYNIIPTAGKTRLGAPHTKETKKKMSKASRGKPKSEQHKKALSIAKLGKKTKPWSEEHKAKLSIAIKKGKKRKGRPACNDDPKYKKLQSDLMKEVWVKRRLGILPMPKNHRKGD